MPVSMNFQWAIRAIQASKRQSSLWQEQLKPCWCHPQCWAKTGGLLYWSMPGFIKQHIGNCQTSEGCHNINAPRGLLGPSPIDFLCSQFLRNNIKERHKRWSDFHFQCNVHYSANTTVGSVLPYRGRAWILVVFGPSSPTVCIFSIPYLASCSCSSRGGSSTKPILHWSPQWVQWGNEAAAGELTDSAHRHQNAFPGAKHSRKKKKKSSFHLEVLLYNSTSSAMNFFSGYT